MHAGLQNALERRNLVFIIGTGYSAATSDGSEVATWRGLIADGISRATTLGAKQAWADQVSGTLSYGFGESDMDMILSAATMVVKELDRLDEHAYSAWLRDSVGRLPNVHPELGKRLRSLPFPILTTNYDSLLENNDRRGTDWTKPVEMQRLLAGVDSRDIGHLHGVWNNPQSVVLSERHYDRLLASDSAQSLQRAASTLKSLVYVGYGAGLSDPNFKRMIDWHRSTFEPSGIDHFRLCRSRDRDQLMAEHGADQITPVVYGDEYSDLPVFLAQLSHPASIDLTRAGIARDVVGEAQSDFADELKTESIIADTVDDLADRPLSEVIRPPVLLPVPHSEYLKARTSKTTSKIERLEPKDEIKHGDVLVIAAEENTGLTTALKWLALEASNYLAGVSPIYVMFSACKKRRNPLEDIVRLEAHRHQLISQRADPLPPYVLALDNFSPYVDGLSEATLQDVRSSDAMLTVIGCVQGAEEEISNRLERLGVRNRIRYLGKLSAADVREYARLASPQNHQGLAAQVLAILQAENLAKTPFTVSLLLAVLVQGGKFAKNASQTSVLDDYIGLLLGRGDPHDDARFGLDQSAREALLSGLAQAFVEAGVGGLSEIDVQASFQATFDRFGWTESTTEVLQSFIERRVLKRKGGHIEFARSSFLHIFAAKRATLNGPFRDTLLARPLYYSAAITDYAALYRHDADLLRRLSELLEKEYEAARPSSVFEPMELGTPRRIERSADPISDEIQAVPIAGSVEEQPSESTEWDDELFDSADDEDLPAFPTIHEDEVPPAQQLLRTLELVSTVLRDSDQIEDLGLKQSILHEVLERWATSMDVIHNDSSVHDFVRTLMADLELVKKDGSNEVELFNELTRAVPAAIVLSDVGATLASRKLTKLLEWITSSGTEVSEQSLVIACFFQYTLAEPGWPGRLSKLLTNRGNIWIVRNFLLHLLISTYINDHSASEDADDLRDLCVLIIQQATNYKDEPERRSHKFEVSENLNSRRLKARVRGRLTHLEAANDAD